MRNIDPPAIVHDHVDLASIADEINATFIEAEEHAKKGAELYAMIGQRLLTAKAAVGHGGWGKWVEKNLRVKAREASNYMRLAKSAKIADLKEAWKIITGNVPDEDEMPEVQPAATVTSQEDVETVVEDAPPVPPVQTPPVTPAPGAIQTAPTQAQKPAAAKPAEKPAPKPPEKQPDTLKDEVDAEVPPGLESVFRHAADFRTMLNTLNGVNRQLKELAHHPAGAMIRLQQAEVDLENLKRTIRFDMPFAVCPVCEGFAKTRLANCPCKSRGWLNKASYGNLPQEYRA